MRRYVPTPAMAVALLALLVALGGSAYAVTRIDGSVLKNRSVSRTKLKKDTLTGAEIKESTLGKVPTAAKADAAATAASAATATSAATAASATRADLAARADAATNADHAAKATDADTVGGLSPDALERSGRLVRFSARMASTDPDRPLAQLGPFTITAHCEAPNAQQNFIRAFVSTSENDAAVRGIDFFGTAQADADLDVGDQQTIEQYQESGTPPLPSGPHTATMTMVAPSGAHVEVSLALGTRLLSDNASARVPCLFTGYAVVS